MTTRLSPDLPDGVSLKRLQRAITREICGRLHVRGAIWKEDALIVGSYRDDGKLYHTDKVNNGFVPRFRRDVAKGLRV